MKTFYLSIFSCFFFAHLYSQDIKGSTDDGKPVLLKSNGTWSYVNETDNKVAKKIDKFVEPEGDKKMQPSLKRVGATVTDMKKHVSVDTGCKIEDIILKELSEQPGNAIYILDVCGKIMKYKRTGSVFYKDGDKIL